MKLLVVEESARAASVLSAGLVESGFEVEPSTELADAVKLAASRSFSLVVLGFAFDGVAGFDALRAIRASSPGVPVLVVSDGRRSGDRQQAFEAGADSYVTRPYAFPELLARVRALLRRSDPPTSIKVADLELDLEDWSPRFAPPCSSRPCPAAPNRIPPTRRPPGAPRAPSSS